MYKLFIFFYLIHTQGLQKNVCVNGKDPQSLTDKEYLTEFSKGPCAPVLMIPPLTGTKLQVEIDCQILKIKQPRIFSDCGWTHCEKQIWEVWKSVPEKEYKLWISDFTSEMAFMSINPQKSKCWAHFFAISEELIDSQNTLNQFGYQVSLYGQSKGTKGQGQCGIETCTKMLPAPIQITKTLLIYYWVQMFEEMGYKNGLTFQLVPYDWRKSMKNNQLNVYFKSNLERLHQLSNKKVVLVSHSYGVPNTYYQLTKLSQEEKDKMIKNVIHVAGNLHGVLTADYTLLMPNLPYSFGPLKLHFEGELIGFTQNVGIVENATRDVTKFQNQKWYQALQKRRAYELGQLELDESGYDFLPSRDEECSPSNFRTVSTKCLFGFNDDDDYQVRVGEKKYFKKDMVQLIRDEAYFTNTVQLREQYDNEDVFNLQNPGVSIISFVLRANKTPIKMEWEDRLRTYQENKIYYEPKITMGNGDGMIDINSQMYGPMKWAFEFKQGVKNAKPQKIIDFCSTYNLKDNIYDNDEGEREITKNEFSGVKCECQGDNEPVACDHATMMADENVLRVGKNIVMTFENGYTESHQKYIQNLDPQLLKAYQQSDCPQISLQLIQMLKILNCLLQQ